VELVALEQLHLLVVQVAWLVHLLTVVLPELVMVQDLSDTTSVPL
jgi:hypothetical protein